MLFSAILKPAQTLYGIILIVLTGTPYYLVFVTKIVRIPALFRLSGDVSNVPTQARQTRSNSGGVAEGQPRFDKGGVALMFYFLRVKNRTF